MKMNGFRFYKPVFVAIFAVCAAFPAFSQTSFSRGEALFLDNKPQEALQFLEAAVADDPAHVQAFIYLGIAYLQLNRVDDSIAVFEKILPRGGSETARIAFNLGNAYFKKGNYQAAMDNYSKALAADPSFSTAMLNRANSKIQTGALKDAVADYQSYLVLDPQSSQRSQIEKLVAFINDQFAAEEQRAAQQKLAEEQAQAAAAEAARQEQERRQRLLDEVSASLQAAAEDSKGLSAGNEGVQGYDGEFELE